MTSNEPCSLKRLTFLEWLNWLKQEKFEYTILDINQVTVPSWYYDAEIKDVIKDDKRLYII